MRRARGRRRLVRLSILVSNLALFALVGGLIFKHVSAEGDLPDSSSRVAMSIATRGETANPLDKLSSADIAVNVARMTSLEESTAVTNNADSIKVQQLVAPSDSKVVAKPAIVATSLKSSKDIVRYSVVPGDTVAKIAAKYGVTSETIRLSNGLTSNSVTVGQKLWISPINGLVYIVKRGDTPASLASRYGASKDQIIAFNDAEVNGLIPGQAIVIPNGLPQSDGYHSAYAQGFSFGSAPVYNGNGYAYGFCTWGVANLIKIPSNWGDAYTWARSAAMSGWSVSPVPTAGSIAQRSGGYGGLGHVAIVTEVSPDGKKMKYKDMNGIAGWGSYGTTPDWVSVSEFENYITR